MKSSQWWALELLGASWSFKQFLAELAALALCFRKFLNFSNLETRIDMESNKFSI